MGNKLIIVINGRGGVGKDALIQSLPYRARVRSSIDPIKALAKSVGWQGEKTDGGRKLLSDLKMAVANYNDLPTKHLMVQVNRFLVGEDEILFVMIREPREIQHFIESVGDKCPVVTLLVRREIQQPFLGYGNESDDGVELFDYDHTFDNDGEIEECQARFAELIADIASEKGIRLEATA